MSNSTGDRIRVADPWVLGLYGLAGATFIVAAHMAGWYGGPESVLFLAPFVAVLGGVAPLLAAMWAYEARDELATAMLGTWGSFWIGYGLLNALFVSGKLQEPKGAFSEFGFWFIAVAAITWVGAVAAAAESTTLVVVLGVFAGASTVAAIGEGFGRAPLAVLAGWLFMIAAVCAWYMATARLCEAVFGHTVLPLGKPTRIPSASPAATADASALRTRHAG